MRPFTLLIKPSGSDCNINCSYCFYKNRAPEIGQGKQRMGVDVLEKMTQDYLGQGFPVNTFSWQGGEPTLMGLDFYRQAVGFQDRYSSDGQEIGNALQTNGILIDEAWCAFMHKHKFLAGISLDGPQQLHDHYRKDLGGHGTWERVIRGIENCQKYEVEFNCLVLVNRLTGDHAYDILDFFLERGITFLQFIPCVELDPQTGEPTDFSVTPQQYGEFLCDAFDRWLELGPTKLSIRDFDSMVNYCVTGAHTICTFGQQCADYIVIEHRGDAYPCDFFVEPDLILGNIMETPMEKLAAGAAKRQFARKKKRMHTSCLICSHLDMCRGGCMKDRIPMGNQNATPLSYFCEGYKRFFAHAQPRLAKLAAEINAQLRSPEDS
jgi:uncharacterized protein